MMELLTKHYTIKLSVFELWPIDSPGCDRCKYSYETASHILSDCKTLAVLRFMHLGHHFLQSGDFADISVRKVLYFIRCCWLLKQRVTLKIENGQVQGSLHCPPCCTLPLLHTIWIDTDVGYLLFGKYWKLCIRWIWSKHRVLDNLLVVLKLYYCWSFHIALQSFWSIGCIRFELKNECFGELLNFQHQYQLVLMIQTDKVFNQCWSDWSSSKILEQS